MECEVCFSEVMEAGATGSAYAAELVSVFEHSNSITCSGCGKVVCLACCRDPQSGFCDECTSGVDDSYVTVGSAGLVEIGNEPE
jgi:hypothetical protein